MASRLILRSFKSLNGTTTLSKLVTPTVIQANTRLSLALNANTNSRCFSASSIVLQAESSNVLKDLSSFLKQEIKQENDNRKYKNSLPKVAGFEVKTEGPNVTLTKSHESEKITVKFNINGSLDDSEPHVDEQMELEKSKNEADAPQMKSRPPFTIDIAKEGQVLSFGCSFLAAEEGVKDAVEDFQIDEFAIHNGEWNENVFTADCSVLDGNLYDILLSLLDERGMGEQFANELAEFSTAFEHSQYIGLLEKLQKFSK